MISFFRSVKIEHIRLLLELWAWEKKNGRKMMLTIFVVNFSPFHLRFVAG